VANKVVYILELQDKYSRVAQKIKTANERVQRSMEGVKQKARQTSLQIRKFAQEVDLLNKMSDVGKRMTLGLTLPITFAGKKLLDAASDAEESRQKFGVVFEDVSIQADKMRNSIAKSYGMSKLETTELMAATGDLLAGFGFEGDMALDLSSKVQTLAADLASFGNIQGGTKRASEALTKGLLGERESMKLLGIAILEEDVKAKVQALAATGALTGMTMRQAKAYATLQLATEQSTNAEGDFKRSSSSLANQQRIMKARISDVSVELGSKLIPIALKAITVINKVTDWFGSLSDTSQNVILSVLGIVAVLGPVLVGLAAIVSAVGVLAPLFSFLAAGVGILTTAFSVFGAVAGIALAPAILPFLAIGAAIAAVIAALYLLWDNYDAIVSKVSEGIEFVANVLGIDKQGEGESTGGRSGKLAAAAGTKDVIEVVVKADQGTTAEAAPPKRRGGGRSNRSLNVGVNTVASS
tara:strand:+ start:12535 stop:13941 length:1407 start_codon:yes stop_codon:yes gene_type:complete